MLDSLGPPLPCSFPPSFGHSSLPVSDAFRTQRDVEPALWGLLLKAALEHCTDKRIGEVGAREVGKVREKRGRKRSHGYRRKRESSVSSLDTWGGSYVSPHKPLWDGTLSTAAWKLEWARGGTMRKHRFSLPTHASVPAPGEKPGGNAVRVVSVWVGNRLLLGF